MRFRYVGAGDDPPKEIEFMGYKFALDGKAVDVVEKEVIAKLTGHRCFKRPPGRPRKADGS